MIGSWLKSSVLELLSRTGRRVTRDPLMSYFDAFGIDCVFDVGANVGQYGTRLRRLGYRRRIESFEPIPTAYKRLEETASSDRLWESHCFC